MRFSFSSLLVASALVTACSSNGTVTTANDGGASDGGANVPEGGAADASAVDASSAADSGPKCDTAGTTSDQCQACCEAAFPDGYQLFAKLTLACACNPVYCGPPDSGVFEGGAATGDDAGAGASGDDAGLYGTAPCSAATCAYTAQPSDACNSCIFETLGNTAQPGTCGVPVLEACITDPNCYPFSNCVEECPP